ncbi:MAG: hypothetical protein AAFX50_24725, partial [Acidobacteriota bacterium]
MKGTGRWFLLLAAGLAAASGAPDLDARPGGGESFGAPGGGGGDDGLIYFFFRIWLEIVIRYPAFGVPATLVMLFLMWRHQKARAGGVNEVWDSAPPSPAPPAPPHRHYDFDPLIRHDEHFSPALFDDFAYALFAKAHGARSRPGDLEALAPYLSEAARRHLAERQPRGAEVSRVLVGAMR